MTNSSFTSLSYTANMEYDVSYLKFWIKKKLLGRYSHPSVQINVQNKLTNSSFTSLSYTANMEYDASYLKFWTKIKIIKIILKIKIKKN